MTNRAPRPRRRAAPPLVEAGNRLGGRYRLERRIGHGGSADVWQARDERLGRTVAIKTLHPHLLPDGASRARFAAEARALAGLSHPAIVPVYDVIEDPRSPAIVLRYVGGTTLVDRLASSSPMTEREAIAIGTDLAGALAHAHRLGIVHRDVKPANVLVDDEGRAQLVDFGIARVLADAAGRETTTGQVMGTLRYMAPEQLAGGTVDGRTDLFALGLVLHELLTGSPAFNATSPAELVDSQRRGPPQPPSRADPELRRLLDELLAPDPSDRPADAAEVEARLREIGLSLDARSSATAADARRSEGAPPTLMPGLPAATAGLALAAPPDMHASSQRDRPPDREPPAERETVAFTAAPTAAIAVPAAAASLASAAPVAAAAPVPATTNTRRRSATRARPGSGRGRRRAVLLGAGGVGIAALVLATVAAGFGIDQPFAVAGATTASPALPSAIGNPTPASTIPGGTSPKPHPSHRGHGRGDGG